MSLVNGRFPLKVLDCAIRSDSREVLRSSRRCHWWGLLAFLLTKRGIATQREWTDSLALVSLLLKVSCQQTGPPSEKSLTGRCLLLNQCSSHIQSCAAANNRSEETRVQLTSHCWMWLMSVPTWNHWVIQTETIQSGKTKHPLFAATWLSLWKVIGYESAGVMQVHSCVKVLRCRFTQPQRCGAGRVPFWSL